jgi:hypothetical protein
MKHRRLQHAADTLCHMFCGWRLANCYRDLERLGSGVLTIDVINAECSFNGHSIDPLSIALELQAWLHADLANNHLDVKAIDVAALKATLRLTPIHGNSRQTPSRHLDPKGKPITKGLFNRLEIECHSHVSTDEKTYLGSYGDVEEWPTNWPSA